MNIFLTWILCGAVTAAFEIHHCRDCPRCHPIAADLSLIAWYAYLVVLVVFGPLAVFPVLVARRGGHP